MIKTFYAILIQAFLCTELFCPNSWALAPTSTVSSNSPNFGEALSQSTTSSTQTELKPKIELKPSPQLPNLARKVSSQASLLIIFSLSLGISGLILSNLALIIPGTLGLILGLSLFMFLVFEWLVHFPGVAQSSEKITIGEQGFLRSFDGTKLHYRLLRNKNQPAKGTVLLLHDKQQNISQNLPEMRAFLELGYNVFTYDYRSYGQSQGSSSERVAYSDAQAAYQFLHNELPTKHNLSVQAKSTIVYGQGLGANIGAELASKLSSGLFISSSGTSDTPRYFAERFPKIFSLFKRFITYQFDQERWMRDIDIPTLIIHSVHNPLVSIRHAERLAQARSFKSNSEYFPLTQQIEGSPEDQHHRIIDSPEVLQAIESFIQKYPEDGSWRSSLSQLTTEKPDPSRTRKVLYDHKISWTQSASRLISKKREDLQSLELEEAALDELLQAIDQTGFEDFLITRKDKLRELAQIYGHKTVDLQSAEHLKILGQTAYFWQWLKQQKQEGQVKRLSRILKSHKDLQIHSEQLPEKLLMTHLLKHIIFEQVRTKIQEMSKQKRLSQKQKKELLKLFNPKSLNSTINFHFSELLDQNNWQHYDNRLAYQDNSYSWSLENLSKHSSANLRSPQPINHWRRSLRQADSKHLLTVHTSGTLGAASLDHHYLFSILNPQQRHSLLLQAKDLAVASPLNEQSLHKLIPEYSDFLSIVQNLEENPEALTWDKNQESIVFKSLTSIHSLNRALQSIQLIAKDKFDSLDQETQNAILSGHQKFKLGISSVSMMSPDWFRNRAAKGRNTSYNERNLMRQEFEILNFLNGQSLVFADFGLGKTEIEPQIFSSAWVVDAFREDLPTAWQEVSKQNTETLRRLKVLSKKHIEQQIKRIEHYQKHSDSVASQDILSKQLPVLENIAKVDALLSHIEQLYKKQNYVKTHKDPYILPKLITQLSYHLELTPYFRCKSGKDRTGYLWTELLFQNIVTEQYRKLWPLYQDKQAQQTLSQFLQTKNFSANTLLNLLRAYTRPYLHSEQQELSLEEQSLLRTLSLHAGNEHVQWLNTGLPGSKLKFSPKALSTRLGAEGFLDLIAYSDHLQTST